jgi:hypothetical protein
MDVAVLLGELRARVQRNVHLAMRDMDEFGTQGAHQTLGVKACDNFLL